MEQTDECRNQIRIAVVSCHEPNSSLIRIACASELKSHTITVLCSMREVSDYAHATFNGPQAQLPYVLLLDLDTAPEPSWFCTELMAGQTRNSDLLVIGLVEAPQQQQQAEARFDAAVSAVLPLPRTASEAQSLIRLVVASMDG